MNNSLLPREKKKSPGVSNQIVFSLFITKKKKSTKSYQHSAFSAIGAQIIDYV